MLKKWKLEELKPAVESLAQEISLLDEVECPKPIKTK
jgi:hypothetical protein